MLGVDSFKIIDGQRR